MITAILIFTVGIIIATVLVTCLASDYDPYYHYDSKDVYAIVGITALALTLIFAGGLGIFFGLQE